MNYPEIFLSFLPELVLVLTALGIIGAGIASERGSLPGGLRYHLWWLGSIGLVAAIALLYFQNGTTAIPGNMLALDPLSRFFKIILLVMSLLALTLRTVRPGQPNEGEYVGLVLLATVGLLLVVGSTDLLMVFIALELASLTLYILSGFDRGNPQAAEAALKYFLFGSVAAAFMLYGFSLLYGYTHSTYLPDIAASLAGQPMEPLLATGIIMILAGFGFKVAAVPFHLWAPDTYQSAPLSCAALIAAGSKVAGFFILAKILMVGLAGMEGSGAWGGFAAGWVPLLIVLAAFSMLLGNLAALAQRSSVRRLLGYSAIAHGGYILLGLSAATEAGVVAVLFYVILYGFTSIGTFGIVSVVQMKRGGDRPEDFAGLSREMPGMAFCLLIFLISLAGIPPLAGFFGKFNLFLAALNSDTELARGAGLLWVVALGVALNAVSLYYYLLILKQVYLSPPPETQPEEKPESPTYRPTRIAVVLTAAAIVFWGIFPNQLLSIILGKLPPIH